MDGDYQENEKKQEGLEYWQSWLVLNCYEDASLSKNDEATETKVVVCGDSKVTRHM